MRSALLFFLLLIVCLSALIPVVSAFHAGGPGDCSGCHTMHNNYEDESVAGGAGPGAGPFLLKSPNQSEACLICHEGTGEQHFVSSPYTEDIGPANFTPGGDFGWLKNSFRWRPAQGAAADEYSYGERHGHNIMAPNNGYDADSTLTAAPGGAYAAASLHCSSCHDPHGRFRRNSDGTITTDGDIISASGSYSESPDPTPGNAVGVYRLLAGAGYQPESYTAVTFVNDPPAAVAPLGFNKSEEGADTRVAYGMGMSEWCANCHGDFHQDTYISGLPGQRHPSGNGASLGVGGGPGGARTVAEIYNAYLSSGNLGGTLTSAYTSLVPFEVGIEDHSVGSYATLKSVALANVAGGGPGAAGPTDTANVMCLSCHRAHASGWNSIMRWNTRSEVLAINGVYPGTENAPPEAAQGRTLREAETAYYRKPATRFGSSQVVTVSLQRSLCNKCHGKD